MDKKNTKKTWNFHPKCPSRSRGSICQTAVKCTWIAGLPSRRKTLPWSKRCADVFLRQQRLGTSWSKSGFLGFGKTTPCLQMSVSSELERCYHLYCRSICGLTGLPHPLLLPKKRQSWGLDHAPGFRISRLQSMAEVQGDNHGAWLKFTPCCMSEQDWKVASQTPEAVLSHRSCPWGGHLIKLESKTLGWIPDLDCIILFTVKHAVDKGISMKLFQRFYTRLEVEFQISSYNEKTIFHVFSPVLKFLWHYD